jgi:hypothetical protein
MSDSTVLSPWRPFGETSCRELGGDAARPAGDVRGNLSSRFRRLASGLAHEFRNILQPVEIGLQCLDIRSSVANGLVRSAGDTSLPRATEPAMEALDGFEVPRFSLNWLVPPAKPPPASVSVSALKTLFPPDATAAVGGRTIRSVRSCASIVMEKPSVTPHVARAKHLADRASRYFRSRGHFPGWTSAASIFGGSAWGSVALRRMPWREIKP